MGSDNVVAAAKDDASAKGLSAYIDTATSKYFFSAKDSGSFDTDEDNVTFDTAKNLDVAKGASSANDVASAEGACYAEGVAASVDATAVIFDLVLTPRPVRVYFLFFGPIISTRCHRYRSISYQFTVWVKIAFHKEDFPDK